VVDNCKTTPGVEAYAFTFRLAVAGEELIVLDDASLDASLATGGGGATGVDREGRVACRGGPFSARSTAARCTMGLRGCHLQSS
jgi:hypothetical protein